MADIKGTNLASGIVPFTTDDTYPTHYAEYGKGGWREVATTADRDAISDKRKSEGMVVYVQENKKNYQLQADGTWKELATGGSSGGGPVLVDGVTLQENSSGEIACVAVTDGNSGTLKYWSGTLAEYNALSTKDSNILYNITDDANTAENSNYIPSGTIFTVELDGSGNFTTIKDAYAYLERKYSNGTVTIKVGEGIFDCAETIYFPSAYKSESIPSSGCGIRTIQLVGAGKDKTIIRNTQTTNYAQLFILTEQNTNFVFSNLTLKGIDPSLLLRGILSLGSTQVTLSNINALDFGRGAFIIRDGSLLYLTGTEFTFGSSTSTKVDTCFQILAGGRLAMFGSTKIIFKNVTTAISNNGGVVAPYPGATFSFSSVTNKTTNSNQGLYMGQTIS